MHFSATLQYLEKWIGRAEVLGDRIASAPINALRATFDRPTLNVHGTELPLLWQWLFFLSPARARDLDVDGHPKRGGFLPPVPLPR
jgi:3-methylfumaryl-CoA hydratase